MRGHDMRILVTGPNSFSGKTILEGFINNGYEVTVISRTPLSYHGSQNIRCIRGDLAHIKQLGGVFDAVVHIAATSPTMGVSSANLIQDNILATQNLIQLIQGLQVKKFIFFSTCSVYGEVSNNLLDESTPIYNPCPYGASKLMCEAILREQTTFQSIAIRLPAVIGRGAARHWLANTIKKAKTGEDIIIYNPEALFNNAIAITALFQFIDHLLHFKWPYSFDYLNVASKHGLPIFRIVEKILASCHSTSNVITSTTKKPFFSISSQYAIDNYAFEPLMFEEVLDHYLFEC